jgi:hypothetical protein
MHCAQKFKGPAPEGTDFGLANYPSSNSFRDGPGCNVDGLAARTEGYQGYPGKFQTVVPVSSFF